MNIKKQTIKKYSKKFNKKKTNKVFKNVNNKIDFKKLLVKSNYILQTKTKFNKTIDIESKITNQKSSGRCWIFAFLNLIRLKMIKKYNLPPDFEFSQNYLFFYDKLEQSNIFLTYVINNLDKDLYSIKKNQDLKMIFNFDNLLNDGGTWNIFRNLIEKYGIIPKENMNDTHHSENSGQLNKFLNNYLRKQAHFLFSNKETVVKSKDSVLEKILYNCYKILVLFLGEPPEKIDWSYYKIKKNKKKTKLLKTIKNITPLEFYKKHVPYSFNDKICLINYPCKNTPYYKVYNIEDSLENKTNSNTQFINVPCNVMKKAIEASIDNKEAVWTGIDVGKFRSNKFGFLDQNGFNYKDIFGFNNYLDKCAALTFKQSAPTHAVIIRGYNTDNTRAKYMVENSWGNDKQDVFKGHFTMSEKWFDDYVYIIVVDKDFVDNKVKLALKNKPIVLPYWSPFGNLLQM